MQKDQVELFVNITSLLSLSNLKVNSSSVLEEENSLKVVDKQKEGLEIIF